MLNRVSATLRLIVFFGLAAATVTGSLSGSAYADDHDNRNRQWNGSRQEHARQQVQHQEHWRGQQRYQSYYGRPDVYNSAPPVVYQPPGASIYLSIPYFYN
jgi:hypothetical protein